ncbi:hypothetical protein [Pseudomonas sp. RL_5y_Pfl2_73]|uniref:hypothetical protein n=1 Tax=Pseudomonas sp. RL_5y_Pfl2_73 TaxID=3088713 RepID=UPI0030D90AC5
MRDLTLAEIEMISGAVGPLGAVAGAAAAGAGYVGTQAGSGSPATWTGAGAAMVGGAVTGFFTPATTAQAAGCSGLMNPDTHLGENARQIEVSHDQTTPFLFC